MGELILVRHGQTDANASGLLQGRLDLALNERGRRQAVAQAAALGPIVRDGAALVSSSLLRARQTAEAFGPVADIDDRWIEVDYGVLDGTPVAEVPAPTWAAWRADAEFAPPGGESMGALGRRVRAACEALSAAGRDTTVVVVTHVSPIKAAVAWALGVDDAATWRMQVDQASITRLRLGTRPALLEFNRVAHLLGVG